MVVLFGVIDRLLDIVGLGTVIYWTWKAASKVSLFRKR